MKCMLCICQPSSSHIPVAVIVVHPQTKKNMTARDFAVAESQQKARPYRDDETFMQGCIKRPCREGLAPVVLTTAAAVLDDDKGCCCDDASCPWHWKGSSGGLTHSCSEPSFVHGPLLTVKEYRDPRTREIK